MGTESEPAGRMPRGMLNSISRTTREKPTPPRYASSTRPPSGCRATTSALMVVARTRVLCPMIDGKLKSLIGWGRDGVSAGRSSAAKKDRTAEISLDLARPEELGFDAEALRDARADTNGTRKRFTTAGVEGGTAGLCRRRAHHLRPDRPADVQSLCPCGARPQHTHNRDCHPDDSHVPIIRPPQLWQQLSSTATTAVRRYRPRRSAMAYCRSSPRGRP